MHHFFGLMIDLSYYNEVIIYLYIFTQFPYQYLFIIMLFSCGIFIISHYLVYFILFINLVSICCYQISGFTIRARLTARINFRSIHYQQFVKFFDKLFVKPFAMVTYLVFFLLIIMLIITV